MKLLSCAFALQRPNPLFGGRHHRRTPQAYSLFFFLIAMPSSLIAMPSSRRNISLVPDLNVSPPLQVPQLANFFEVPESSWWKSNEEYRPRAMKRTLYRYRSSRVDRLPRHHRFYLDHRQSQQQHYADAGAVRRAFAWNHKRENYRE
jgi:hypothetical protein